MIISKYKYNSFIAFLSIIFAIFFMFFSIDGFLVKVRKNETTIVNNNLVVAAENGAEIVNITFNNYLSSLKMVATSVQQYDLKSPEVLEILDEICKKNNFERLVIDYADGNSATSDGYKYKPNRNEILDKTLKGESFITNVTTSAIDYIPIINFSTPIYDENGETIAGLRLTMSTEELSNVIDLKLFDSEGYYHLIDKNGRYVALGSSANALLMDQNFFDAIVDMDYEKGFNHEQIMSVFTGGKPVFSKYSVGNAKRYSYCQPVGINNWVLMTIIPSDVVSKMEKQNINFATQMTGELAIVLVLVFLFIFYIQRRARITAVLNDKCFRALSEQTGRIIFEWDFSKNRITSMNNFRSIFGRDMVTLNSPEEAIISGAVHIDDSENFKKVFTQILNSNTVDNINFRVLSSDGNYRWCQISGTIVKDDKGRPYKAIGSLEDINDYIVHQEMLKQKSEKDQLTGLYNKTTTEILIKQALESDESKQGCDALLILDIDNFKLVNDRLGHQYGDALLKQCAEIIRPLIRSSDIVGRIGGDEFFVFLRECGSSDIAMKKAAEICRKIESAKKINNIPCSISVSIGIALAPLHGTEFEELYRKADIALYTTKEHGKNGYMVYDDSFGIGNISSRTAIDTE